ncbi:MAG: hypothetical protein ACXWQ6_00345, partial [Candidatus Limnocylindrales bacterium]
VGQRGGRVQAVVAELGGEKIDIIPWSDDPATFVANALSPAQVVGVRIDEENRIANVTVPERMLSLAIGREGQNARLAAKLTGWRIDIRSDQAPQPEPEPAVAPAAQGASPEPVAEAESGAETFAPIAAVSDVVVGPAGADDASPAAKPKRASRAKQAAPGPEVALVETQPEAAVPASVDAPAKPKRASRAKKAAAGEAAS